MALNVGQIDIIRLLLNSENLFQLFLAQLRQQVSSVPLAEENVWSAEGHVSLKGLNLALLSSVSWPHQSDTSLLPIGAMNERRRIVFPNNFHLWGIGCTLSALFRTSQVSNNSPPPPQFKCISASTADRNTIFVGRYLEWLISKNESKSPSRPCKSGKELIRGFWEPAHRKVDLFCQYFLRPTDES